MLTRDQELGFPLGQALLDLGAFRKMLPEAQEQDLRELWADTAEEAARKGRKGGGERAQPLTCDEGNG